MKIKIGNKKVDTVFIPFGAGANLELCYYCGVMTKTIDEKCARCKEYRPTQTKPNLGKPTPKSFFDYSTKEKKHIVMKAAVEGAKVQKELMDRSTTGKQKVKTLPVSEWGWKEDIQEICGEFDIETLKTGGVADKVITRVENVLSTALQEERHKVLEEVREMKKALPEMTLQEKKTGWYLSGYYRAVDELLSTLESKNT